MAIAALMLGGIRWTLPGPVDGWEYAYRAGCAVFALLCLWGAWQLWQMGRER